MTITSKEAAATPKPFNPRAIQIHRMRKQAMIEGQNWPVESTRKIVYGSVEPGIRGSVSEANIPSVHGTKISVEQSVIIKYDLRQAE